MQTHRIAVIPGDGIGSEVVPEGIRVLDAAARRFGIDLRYDGCAEHVRQLEGESPFHNLMEVK